MDVLPGELSDLVQFQWIQKHRKTGEFVAGVVRVPVDGFVPPPVPALPQKRGRRRQVEAPTPTGPTPTRRGVAGAGQGAKRAAKVKV